MGPTKDLYMQRIRITNRGATARQPGRTFPCNAIPLMANQPHHYVCLNKEFRSDCYTYTAAGGILLHHTRMGGPC